MKLGIFGTGYVGLVTAVCFAELGHSVVAEDKNPDAVARLQDGIPTFYEPGLCEKLASNLESGRLTFTTRAEDALCPCDIIFICVGTPPRGDGGADLAQIEEVARSIAPLLNGYKLIVEKSTVPVNTAHWIDLTIRQFANPGHEYDVASNPEFLREGSAIQDFLHPDRIIIGAGTARARSLLRELYGNSFTCPIFVTDVKTAEVIKHAANAFLATKISFINVISDLCDEIGVDVSTVAEGVGLDHRIGAQFLNAGLGYGGSCFPKDLKSLMKVAGELGVDFSLLREVERINEVRPERLMKKLERALWGVRHRTVGVLGVAFKANTDDIRDAPSLKIIPWLKEKGVHCQVYDPQATQNLAKVSPEDARLRYVESVYEAARDADALLILTDWDEFRSMDLDRVRALMRTPIIVDGRNLYGPAEMLEKGFEYYSLGRGDVTIPRTSSVTEKADHGN